MLTKCQESALSWPSFSPKGSCFFLWFIGLWHSPSFNFQSVTISHLCWIWNAHDGDSKYVLAQSQIVATDDKKYIFNFLNLYWILTVARLKVLMLAYFNKKNKTNIVICQRICFFDTAMMTLAKLRKEKEKRSKALYLLCCVGKYNTIPLGGSKQAGKCKAWKDFSKKLIKYSLLTYWAVVTNCFLQSKVIWQNVMCLMAENNRRKSLWTGEDIGIDKEHTIKMWIGVTR